MKKGLFKIIFILILLSKVNSGVIIPDPKLPLEISPSYLNPIGKKGTKLTFRFYLPSISDQNKTPIQIGIGATYLQYIGIQFNTFDSTENFGFSSTTIKHSCTLIQIENLISIPIEATYSTTYNIETGSDTIYNDDKPAEDNIAYCKIISREPSKVFLPGFNYKLILSLSDDIINEVSSLYMDKILSFTVFSSSKNIPSKDIYDIGNFPNILIIPKYNPVVTNSVTIGSLHSVITSPLELEINDNFDFTVSLSFNDWFNWENYIICIRYPKDKIEFNSDSTMEIINAGTTNIPTGNINIHELEEDDDRKVIGFSLDTSYDNFIGHSYLLKFKQLSTKSKVCLSTNSECYIEVFVRYRNSYVIYGHVKIYITINLNDVTLNVIHPETIVNSETNAIEEVYDVFQYGAFQIKFTINIGHKDISNKYILIKQSNPDIGKHVTFVSPSCDFSSLGHITMETIPKCYPITYKNDDPTKPSGIFFYYPHTFSANNKYEFTVWIFFDECGTKDNKFLFGSNSKAEIKFSLSMYNDIITSKYAENRFDESNLFLNDIETSNGITCYNTYMGKKNYNGYLFTYDDYTSSQFNVHTKDSSLEEKMMYREYFDWNIYSLNAGDFSSNQLLENLYLDTSETTSTFKEKYIYSRTNKITESDSVLLRNKLILPSGSYEKLGQFFPMGMGVNSNGKLTPLKAKFFSKYSSKFFTKNTEYSNKCFVSWGFGYSKDSTTIKQLGPKGQSKPPQRNNWITNDLSLLSDKTAIYSKVIDKVNDYSLYSIDNVDWIYDSEGYLQVGDWAFGDDKTLLTQISTDSPIYIYFGYADTCHKYKNLNQKITSLYTPIEIIIGIKYEDSSNSDNNRYLRVMRFIKLFPEGGVFNDFTTSLVFDGFNDVISNHFSFMNPDETSGVCLIEINKNSFNNGIARSNSNTFFLWIFLGSLIESDYSSIASNYPVSNLNNNVKSYGYSNQHSMGINNFYTDREENLKSDISSPLYTMAMSMTSIYQSVSSNYLFYLGSLLVLKKNINDNNFYNDDSKSINIPYYCPFYTSNGNSAPYSLGIFPSFIGAYGKFNSMVDFGNNGFSGFLTKKINNNQHNRILLSNPKMVIHQKGNNEPSYFNTLSFVIHGDGSRNLKIWNGKKSNIGTNEYDTIDSFLLFFNNNATNLISSTTITSPNFKISLYISTTPFYAFGKTWYKLICGIHSSKLEVINSAPQNENNNEPYLSLQTNFLLDYDKFICYNGNKFCSDDLIAFWGLSSNHDSINYFSNYVSTTNSYVISHWSYDTFYDVVKPTISPGAPIQVINDHAIGLKLYFLAPNRLVLPINAIISFNIFNVNNDKIMNSHCVIQNVNTAHFISSFCDTDNSGNINCPIVDEKNNFNIYCYMLDGFEDEKYTFKNYKIELPNQNSDLDSYVNSIIFSNIIDSDTYSYSRVSNSIGPSQITATYLLEPYNLNSYNILELKMEIFRESHPGMKVTIDIELNNYLIDDMTTCKFSFNKIEQFSSSTIDYDLLWSKGNGLIYNCKIIQSSTGKDKILAWIDKRIYKAEISMNSILYFYLSPVKVYPFTEAMDVQIKGSVNSKIIFDTNIMTQFKIQSISTDPTSVVETDEISSILSVTSNIYGDISDYTFKFDFTKTSITSVINSYPIKAIRLFLPNEISFTNQNEVKCYDVDFNKMISCSFEATNILTIILSSEIKSSSTKKILITSFVNPYSYQQIGYLCNYININSYGIYTNIISGKGKNPLGQFLFPQKYCGLRFYHVANPVSTYYPRESATFTFKVGFDYGNGYCVVRDATLPSLSSIIVEFPEEYNLFINEIPTVTVGEYGTDEYSIPSLVQSINVRDIKIYGRRLHIVIGTDTPSTSSTKLFKYWLIIVGPIINPNNPPLSGYTNPFKITAVNVDNSYYYTTGLNGNTYTSDIIQDNNERENKYQWYRGNKITNQNKYIIDIEYNSLYNKAFFQPGRYYLSYIHTSHPDPKAYLYPSYNKLTFPSPLSTLESYYIAPTLYGEGMPFYIGVPCTTPEGIYVISPTQSNNEDYIPPPNLIITVKLINPAEITFNSPIAIPTYASLRLYYYFSEPNVDKLSIEWKRDISVSDLTEIDTINIEAGTITNSLLGISNIYTTVRVGTTALLEDQIFNAAFINKCYNIIPNTFTLSQTNGYSTLSISSSIDLSSQVTVYNAEDDTSLESDDIKILVRTSYRPSFLYCELECFSLTLDEATSLAYPDFAYMSKKIWAYNNIFRRYATFYFDSLTTEKYLYFQGLLRGYQYKLACDFQSTEYHNVDDSSDRVPDGYGTITSGITTLYPENTQCYTFYFTSKPTDNIKKALVNYCQHLYGINGGYYSDGCIVCSDASGYYRAPGYNIDNYFFCLAEECSDHWKDNSVANRLYEVYNNSTGKKKAFTVCATSNRICESSSNNLNTVFNTFISDLKTSSLANSNLQRNDIKYNSGFKQLNYKDVKLESSNIKIDVLKTITQTGYGKWKAYYSNTNGLTVNCYWKLFLEERGTPQIEEVASCMNYDYNCGIFPADNVGIEYEVPDDGKREQLKIQRNYNLYITCANQVPSPIYFSDLIKYGPYSVVISYGKFLKINFYYLGFLMLGLF